MAEISLITIVIQCLNELLQRITTIAPDKVPVRACIYKMHMYNVLAKHIKPILKAFSRHPHCAGVDEDFQGGGMDLVKHPFGIFQVIDYFCFLRPHGFHRNRNPCALRLVRQLRKGVGAARPGGFFTFIPITPSRIDSQIACPKLNSYLNAIFEILNAFFPLVGFLCSHLVVISTRFRIKNGDVQPARLRLPANDLTVVICHVIHPEVRRAAPELQRLNPCTLLRIKKVIHRIIQIVNVESCHLSAM